ncbi:MAG: RdgB/HAM1 family non-canonical purine NTP pyrophosphatase [Rhodobacteraceae bacterium]|nr:RdgB/HAM1 family non-canonical purine NTP pyrophosphatase [Paracoccaceae bacterium]MCY4195818.1 RdgB/HAM1 family non-canonical purine NTP pyrophosphatase [Paracoccaceae bacterium]MCY4326572.1 RdgB/HAM1 family non-canonical purine NTP pyrophosphatase [Paracoccaceae bacterium]
MRSLLGSRIILATGNDGKIREYRQLLTHHDIAMKTTGELGISDPPETETSFAGNARIKAVNAMRASNMIALAEDSGLEVEALQDAPGVATASWATDSSGRNYQKALNRVWQELADSDSNAPYRARFRAVICVTWPDGGEELFAGRVNGIIVWPPRGAGGFGYDPIFVPDGSDRTFAEMTADEKSSYSHRAKAVNHLVAQCLQDHE